MATEALTLHQLAPQVISGDVTTGKTYVGIDFGTSTTVVSIAALDAQARRIRVEPIRIDQRDHTRAYYKEERVNTVIAVYNGTALVGKGANELKYQLKKGRDIWYNFKMELGTDLGAQYYDTVAKQDGLFNIRAPKDAARVFFAYLKMQIEKHCRENGLNGGIEYAVSIPASFEANQRRDLIDALEANGIHIGRPSLIDEPNAAFLSYLHASQDGEKPLVVPDAFDPKVLVFDFGGGTCDISILEISKSFDGMHSKDLAISKFAEMGGIDIDRYITYNYLMPRLLAANNLHMDDFRAKERELIAARLYKYAEELKIMVNKQLEFFQDHESRALPAIKESDSERATISMPISVDTTRGTLHQTGAYLTFKELSDAMQVFLSHSNGPKRIDRQKEYNNIFMPIETALRKANLGADDIDYVLLIGGSAKSPHIQEALRKYFPESEMLIPADLQTHVSCGAAIHSLLLNGLGACVIRPITSEPIIVVTQDSAPSVLLPAGTEIPCPPVTYNGLHPARDGQQTIELPICVGNSNKMLVNIELTNPAGFHMTDDITVTVSMTADKLLKVSATCGGCNVEAEPQNPFANKELTTAERKVKEAERQANNDAVANGGRPSMSALDHLVDAYEMADQSLMAAETLEEIMTLYPSACRFNRTGVDYHNSGNYEKAVEWLRKAAEREPDNAVVLSNLGHDLCLTGHSDEAEQVLRRAVQANPRHAIARIKLADILDRAGKTEEANTLRLEALEIFRPQFEAGRLDDCEKGWMASLAIALGQYDLARKVHASVKNVNDTFFDRDNLAANRGTLPTNL